MTLGSGRKKKYLSSKTGTNFGVKLMEGEYRLIKYDITRDVYTTLDNIETLESLVKIAVLQEDTLFRAEL
jgi:hypothetical protein